MVAVSTTAPENFYPRPPRGGRPLQDVAQYMCCQISIHALREEGDALCVEISRNIYISIHALREEGDLVLTCRMIALKLFLSTPSARRATRALMDSYGLELFLSTPSARRAT